MKKVILIYPPLHFYNSTPNSIDSSVPPLGILYLASYINKYSKIIDASVIDVAAEQLSLKEIAVTIKREKPIAIGISSMTPQLQGTLELAIFLKNNIPWIKIFLGGPHISADPGFINRYSMFFDYAITGEAEKTLLDSLEKLVNNEKIPRIQKGEAIIDLDSLPFPDTKIINRKKYSQHESMLFSRGCPYSCYYCSRPAISKKIRNRSVKNLIEEIKIVYPDCKGKIDFQDDTFTINRKYVLEFCSRVVSENIKLSWRCNTRVDLVDDELLKAMKFAGCELIHFGIESGNERIRKEIIKKGSFTNNDILSAFALCSKYRIKIGGYFMIGHPSETKTEIADTKQMILTSGVDLLGLSIPTPFPGSELYQVAYKEGIINEKIIDQFAEKKLGDGYSGNYPVFIPNGLSEGYLISMMKDINRKFYLNYNTLIKKLKSDATSFGRLKQDAKDFFSLIFSGMSSRKPYKHKESQKN